MFMFTFYAEMARVAYIHRPHGIRTATFSFAETPPRPGTNWGVHCDSRWDCMGYFIPSYGAKAFRRVCLYRVY